MFLRSKEIANNSVYKNYTIKKIYVNAKKMVKSAVLKLYKIRELQVKACQPP